MLMVDGAQLGIVRGARRLVLVVLAAMNQYGKAHVVRRPRRPRDTEKENVG